MDDKKFSGYSFCADYQSAGEKPVNFKIIKKHLSRIRVKPENVFCFTYATEIMKIKPKHRLLAEKFLPFFIYLDSILLHFRLFRPAATWHIIFGRY
jgi:hypothetical protein